MTALAADQDPQAHMDLYAPQQGYLAELTVLDTNVIWRGSILAKDYLSEVQVATNTAGLQVIGSSDKKVDNTLDGETANVINEVRLVKNDTTYPFGLGHLSRGRVAYLVDDQTVGYYASAMIPAGLVLDVDADGVWLDQRPLAMQIARNMQPSLSSIRTTDYDCSAEQALLFSRRLELAWADADGEGLLTLPTAVPGMAFGVGRTDATAGRDIAIQCAGTDYIEGSDGWCTVGKQVNNLTDQVEGSATWWECVAALRWKLWKTTMTSVNYVIDNA